MKLQLNDDGTITVPLAPNGTGAPRSVTMREPTMRELAKLHQVVHEADTALTKVPQLTAEPTAADLAAMQKSMQDRTLESFSETSPHGLAFIESVNLLAEHPHDDYTMDDFYGWAANPQTCGQMLSHFQSPLPGDQ